MTMTTINQPPDIDAKAAVGGSALRPRAGGNGRHHGKIPDMFPAVLADITLSKNVAMEAFKALDTGEKPLRGDDEPETADAQEISPNEEAVPQPRISSEMKQYLQDLGVIGQLQAGREVAVEVQESVDEVLSTVACGHESKAAGLAAEAKIVKDVSENVENPGAPDKHHVISAKPREPGSEETKNYQSPALFSNALVLKDSQIATRLPAGEGLKNLPGLQELAAGSSLKPAQVLPVLAAGNNVRSLQTPSNPQEKKSAKPAEPDSRAAGAPQILSGELPQLETLSDPQEARQTKPADLEVRVIKVETSFSPAASPGFMPQFSKLISEALGSPVKGPVLVAANPILDPRPDVVRSIQIQLHPEDLGKIKVAMHLRGDELRLQIEVTNKKVELLLQNDQQILKDLLGQSGYDIKDASISITLSPGDLLPPQRSTAANDPAPGPFAGQGSRQHPGAGEENQNPFHKARGNHAFAAGFESGQEARLPAEGSRRGSGVFV